MSKFSKKINKNKTNKKNYKIRPLLFWASYEQKEIINRPKTLNSRWRANKIFNYVKVNNPTGFDFGSEKDKSSIFNV